MKLLLAFVSIFSLQSFASLELGSEVLANRTEKSIEFNWNSNRSYYACSYAEGQARKYLRALGAQDISTDCRGGIEYGRPQWSWMPLSLDAQFTVLEQNDNGSEPVTNQKVVLRGNESCEFNVKLIQKLLAQVNHTLVKKSVNCFEARGSYRFEVEVVK